MNSKICGKCKVEKPIGEFNKKINMKDGYNRYCRICAGEMNKKHYHEVRKNKDADYYKEYRDCNKDYAKEYRESHRDEARIYQREWERNKRKTDPSFRLKKVITVSILGALKAYNLKKQDRTLNYLGTSISEYCAYLESLFTPEMNWENYASYWEIDHIKPIDSFDLTDEKQVYECFNYKNTRPLYWLENVQKGKNTDPKFLEDNEKSLHIESNPILSNRRSDRHI